jgi:miniconductance mechanosensitive channel
MDRIQLWVHQLLEACGLEGSGVTYGSHALLVVIAILLAVVAGLLCRRILVPLVLRLTQKTEARWDEVIFNRKVLLSACSIVPAIVIWQLLPWTFYDFPTIQEVLTRLTAIYITVMAVRTLIVFADSFKLLEDGPRTARQQYLYSVCGILKIIVVFVAIIVIIAIIINKDPTTLFAGLGAASAVLMLAFQDTIKGLVAGIRLTNNDMVHIGDWVTVPSAGANGRVEEISLTTVKIRNFDNTIITVTPQTLVDGSFQNWLGMEQREGRKQVRKVYFDFRSIAIDDDGTANITKFRHHIEQWLQANPKVIAEKPILVRQAEATQAGCCVEFIFWLRSQAAIDYEHDTSDIMEYIYAACTDFGLRIYQQFTLTDGTQS